MEGINHYIGSKIRNYRKMKKLTIQQLADTIHKSRATVSKYETGEITLDVSTLWDIASALDVDFSQLTDYQPAQESGIQLSETPVYGGESPFFRAEQLYFYYYDGRYDRLREAIIHIHKSRVTADGTYETSMSIHTTTPTGRSSEIQYTGTVLYSDMLIRFSFSNRHNKLEQDLLYIFNPLELRSYTEGLLCGISNADLMPCAFKCIVALAPCTDHQMLRQQLQISTKELRRWKKLNMLIVDNIN